MRAARLPGHRVPFTTGREGGAAASHQLGVEHLADDALGADLERPAQGLVAAVRAVVVEAVGIDHADPLEEAQTGLAGLRGYGRAGRRRRRSVHDLEQAV